MSRDFESLRRIGIARRAGANESLQGIYPERRPNEDLTEPQVPRFAADPPAPQDAGWIKALAVLRKRWRFAAFIAVVVSVALALVIFLMKPEYEPTARIEIDPPGTETFSMQTTAGSGSETEYLETQAQKLQTDDLAISVIRELRLDRNPDFTKSAHQETRVSEQGGLTPAANDALLTLRSRLKVIHDPNSHILAVSVIAHDPKLAADVTNAMAKAFVERTIQMRRDAINSSRAFLQNQLEEVRIKAEQANRDLAAFQKQTGVADIDEGRNSFGDLMTELNRQTTQIGAERIQLESYLRKAEEGGINSLPQVRDNPVVQKLTQTLAEVRAQLSQNLVIYGVNHPNTKKLRNEELELERQLSVQKKEALDQLKLSYNAARARERLMTAQKEDATKTLADMAEYNNLKKQAQAQSTLYNTLLSRIEETGISAASQSSNIRVVDTARILQAPTRPHRLRDLVLGIFTGVFAGILLAFVRERIDNPVRTPDDVRVWTGGIPSISIIPEFCKEGLSGRSNWPFASGSLESPPTFLLDRPHSPESEAVRGLQAGVVLARGEPLQSLLIASSLPGEGKTTVALNLALALSRQRRTCLLDADLRRPCVAAAFGLQSAKGLGDVLVGSVPFEDVLVPVHFAPGLSVLPAGEGSDDRAHLIASAAMQSIMNSLRSMFDYIVVDSAPILPYAEGRILSTMTDGIIFVARSGLTPGPAMLRSLELLSEVRSPRIVDVVLNAHTPPGHNRYYYPYVKA